MYFLTGELFFSFLFFPPVEKKKKSTPILIGSTECNVQVKRSKGGQQNKLLGVVVCRGGESGHGLFVLDGPNV